MQLRFTKMQGIGNDYVYVWGTVPPVQDIQRLARVVSHRRFGVGGDGLILILPSEKADFQMRIFNADGSEAMMCGNASRCIGKYLYERGLTDKTEIRLETLSGVKTLHLHVSPQRQVDAVTVDMGVPTFIRRVELGAGYPFGEGIALSMGNPHLVIFVDDAESVNLPGVGPLLEHHPLFPHRVNVEFAQITGDAEIRMRVWERGSGITQACGTGACATAVAAAFTHRSPRRSAVRMDGGTLLIHWSEADGTVRMTGPAVSVFDGEISLPG